ncbi:MAG: GAF domain-containing protein [Anaerolineae bacterium]|jgi:hypothetical protein
MVEQIGLLGRARLRRQADRAKKKADRLQVLHTIGTAIASSLEVEEVLTRVVEAAVFISNAEEGSLLLLDEETQELYLRAQKDLGEKYARGFRIRTEDSIAGNVLKRGRTQRLASTAKDLKVVTGYMVKAIVYVPVIIRGKVIGVLSVDNQVKDRSFSESDEHMLAILAGYAAIALENARLVKELDRKAQLLTDAYGVDQLGPAHAVDPETVGIVLCQGSEPALADGLVPQQLASVINPYLSAIADVQHIIDEIEGTPPSKINVLAITPNPPVMASIEGVGKAVQVVKETVFPYKRELAQTMGRLVLREKEIAIEKAEAEALEARAGATQDAAEKDQLLAEAADRYAAVERSERETKRLRAELQQTKIELALNFVTQVNANLPTRETIFYVMGLLPALEHLINSPLRISTMPDHKERGTPLPTQEQHKNTDSHQGTRY